MKTKTHITGLVFLAGSLFAGLAGAQDIDSRDRMRKDLTASIPVFGVIALEELRQQAHQTWPESLARSHQAAESRDAVGSLSTPLAQSTPNTL